MRLFQWLAEFRHDPRRVNTKILRLEQQAVAADPRKQARRWLRLARFCAARQKPDLALKFYGRAIDGDIFWSRYGRASAVCREVIAAYPAVVRARCTLAFLAMRDAETSEFIRMISDYVNAAKRSGCVDLAVARLTLMAEVTNEGPIFDHLNRRIKALGGQVNADHSDTRGVTRDGRRTTLSEDQEKRWGTALRASISDTLPTIADRRPPFMGVMRPSAGVQ